MPESKNVGLQEMTFKKEAMEIEPNASNAKILPRIRISRKTRKRVENEEESGAQT